MALPLPARFLLLCQPQEQCQEAHWLRELTGLKINFIKKKALFPAERKEGVPAARATARLPTGQQRGPHLHQNIGDLVLNLNILGIFFIFIAVLFSIWKAAVLGHVLFVFPATVFT